MLRELRLNEGIFFNFQVSPSQRKAKSHFSRLALVPFREDPFKDSSSYAQTPVKVCSKLSSNSIRSKPVSQKLSGEPCDRMSPAFIRESDGADYDVKSAANIAKGPQITMPLRNKTLMTRTSNEQIEEEVLIESDSASSLAADKSGQQTSSDQIAV